MKLGLEPISRVPRPSETLELKEDIEEIFPCSCLIPTFDTFHDFAPHL